MDFIKDPWPWYVAGPLIAVSMALLLWSGKRFGVSSNFQTLCTIAGADRISDYFKIEWRQNVWNLVFVAGTMIGGFIAANYMMPENNPVAISESTTTALHEMGMTEAGSQFLPNIFSWENLFSFQGIIMIILGGFLVGFGTRWADGCTSGHAISGLSNLQLPSLIAVIGFFIGGLATTWFILPWLLTQ